MLFAQRIKSSSISGTGRSTYPAAAFEARAMQATLEPLADCSPTETPADLEVSVVMPCLNEARTVGRCIDKATQALRDMGVAGEVIIADNGSSDGSPAIAVAHGARVIPVEHR